MNERFLETANFSLHYWRSSFSMERLSSFLSKKVVWVQIFRISHLSSPLLPPPPPLYYTAGRALRL